MERKYLNADIPLATANLPVMIAIITACMTCSILALAAPSLAAKSVVIIIMLVALILIKANVPQLLLLITIVPALFQIKMEQLGLAAFAILIASALFWSFAKTALGRGCLNHHRTLDVLIAINLFFAFNTFISALYNSALNQIAAMEIMRYLLYAGLIGISYDYISDIGSIQKVIWTALVGSIAFSLAGYKIALSAGEHTFDLYGAAFLHASRIGLANANTIATVIANPLPILISYLLYGGKKSYKFLYLIMFSFLFLVWIVWNSRASYIYLFSAIFTLILFNKNRWKYLSILAALAVLILVLALTRAVPILTDFLRLEMGLSHREVLWSAGLRMIAESPLLGKGPAFFDQNKYYYMDPGHGRLVSGTWTGISPHNVLIMRGVDMGILAIIAQIIYWVVPLVFFIKNAQKMAGSAYYYLYLAAGAVWIGIIIRSQFDTGASVFSMILLAAMFRLPQLIQKQTAHA